MGSLTHSLTLTVSNSTNDIVHGYREGFESRPKIFKVPEPGNAALMAASNLRTIAAAWPADPFRPNMQLKTFFESLATHPRLSPAVVQSARVLLDNGVQHRYPLSKKTLEPASMPRHYERLLQGYERSAKGIRRPWWQVFFGIWR